MAKFCTKCGKKLEDGEVCTCSTQNAAPQPSAGQPVYQQQPNAGQPVYQQQPNADQPVYQQQGQPMYQQQGQPMYQQQGQPMYQQQGQPMYQQQGQPMYQQQQNQFVTGMKSMFSELLPILKTPVTATKNIAARGSNAIGLELLGCRAIIAEIILLISFARMNSAAEGMLKLPWFKAILLVALITIGADCLEAVLMKTFCGVFKGSTSTPAMFTVMGSRAVYNSIVLVAAGIFSLMSMNLAIIAIGVGQCIVPFVQYAGYSANVQMEEDKKVYAFFAAKAITVVLVLLVTYLIGKSMITELVMGTMGSMGRLGMGSLNGLF